MNIDGITSVTCPLSGNVATSLIRDLEMEFERTAKTIVGDEDNDLSEKWSYFKILKDCLTLRLRYKVPEGFSLALTGSLQKYFHGKNDNDFYEHELEQVKGELNSYLKMDMVEYIDGEIVPVPNLTLPVTKVEFAINFEIGIDNIEKFLWDNLRLHKNKPFEFDGLVFICKHEHYHLKLYCKGKNTLRYEIVLFTKELRKYQIYTLSDLTGENILPIFQRLKDEATEIIWSEGVNIRTAKNITKREKEKLLSYTSVWWHNDYKNDKAKCKSIRQKKNMNQELYRLKKEVKKILTEKEIGQRQLFLDLVNEKVDSFLIENAQKNLCRL